MTIFKRKVILAIGLLLATSVTACSSSATASQEASNTNQSPTPSNTSQSEAGKETADPASPSDAVTATVPSSIFDDMTGLNDETPKAKAIGKAPTTKPKLLSDIAMGSYTNDVSLTSAYWASDWCHYVIGIDGSTYGESCVRAAPNADGSSSSVQFQIYQYDPARVDRLGNMVLELYVGYPNYTTYRDLTDPLFNQVQWAAFPTGIANLTADTFMVSFLDGNGQLVWYTTQQILDMAAAARANANIPQSTVPAWNPAITVWSYSMIMSINNQIDSIPGAAY